MDAICPVERTGMRRSACCWGRGGDAVSQADWRTGGGVRMRQPAGNCSRSEAHSHQELASGLHATAASRASCATLAIHCGCTGQDSHVACHARTLTGPEISTNWHGYCITSASGLATGSGALLNCRGHTRRQVRRACRLGLRRETVGTASSTSDTPRNEDVLCAK